MSEPENRTGAGDGDAALLERVAAGDRAALAECYDRFSGFVYSVVLAVISDPGEAEEVLQEVFLTLWRRAGRFNPSGGRPLGWIATLARNRAIDHLRARRRRGQVTAAAGEEAQILRGPAEDAAAIDELVSRERAAEVRAALRQLDPGQSRAIELAYFGGLTQAEIAGALHLPLGTVKARIRRGLLVLRRALGPPGDEPGGEIG